VKIRRDIASVPVRSASDTWKAIVGLITAGDSVDAAQLTAAASILETLIAEEQPARSPLVVSGCGARLVIYCVFGEEALDLGTTIDALNWNPTGDGWRLAAPAATRDLAWMNKTLAGRASRICVYDVAVGVPEDSENSAAINATSKGFEIDWKGLSDR